MANGYVHPFMRPPYHQRFSSQPPPRGPPNDPAALFAAQDQAQCAFPNAFPANGPNIIQRFWIRLFKLLILSPYRFVRGQAQQIRDATRSMGWDMMSTLDKQALTEALVENSWSIVIGLVVVVLFSAAAWFFSPKGENNTIWRSTLILSAASCYIMWAITFLSQWHPLIEPKMSKLRPGYEAGS